MVHLQKAVSIRPFSAAAHNNLANALQMLGRYDEALIHYDEALKLNQQYENARRNRQIAMRKLMMEKQKLMK